MTKRLQVLVPDAEYSEIRRIAQSRHISIAQWVRQALQAAKREVPLSQVSNKLEALRAAAKREFPTTDIEQMLEEIGQGNLSSDKP
jgi:hypothetical protein